MSNDVMNAFVHGAQMPADEQIAVSPEQEKLNGIAGEVVQRRQALLNAQRSGDQEAIERAERRVEGIEHRAAEVAAGPRQRTHLDVGGGQRGNPQAPSGSEFMNEWMRSQPRW
jgi:hypothetical protein